MGVNRVNGASPRAAASPDRTYNQVPAATSNEAKRELSGSPTSVLSNKKSLGSTAGSPTPVGDFTGTEEERQALATAVDDLNRTAQIFDRRFEFRIHEETNRVIVDVYDRETDELIREIPPEKILDAVAKMQELLGLLFDERV